MKDLKRGEICDSIRGIQALQIHNFKEVVEKSEEQISILKLQNTDLTKDLDKSRLQLKAVKKVATYGIPGGLITGFILGILVSN